LLYIAVTLHKIYKDNSPDSFSMAEGLILA